MLTVSTVNTIIEIQKPITEPSQLITNSLITQSKKIFSTQVIIKYLNTKVVL